MRVAVLGCGSIGTRHIGNLLALGCEVQAFDVSAPARQAILERYPGQVQVDDRLSFDRVDALVIATPLESHLMWVEEAIRRRLPFFVEKPLGTLEQLPRWRELAALQLPVNQVGYQLRFHPVANTLREHCTARAGTFTVACDMRTWPGQGYGPMLLELSHEIDLALWCGAPVTVTYAALTDHTAALTLGDWCVALDSRAPRYRRFWRVSDQFTSYQQAFRSPDELGEAMYVDELQHFLLCVRHSLPSNVPLADGLRVLEVCQQVEQLARQTA